METAERISLPDDCTVGYIVNALLGASLTRSPLFHSHLENLGLVSDVRSQVHTHTRMRPRRSGTRTAPLNPASPPLGDAQLRSGRGREEHGQPERPDLTQGGSHEVKHPSRCQRDGGKFQRGHKLNIQTFPERAEQKYTSIVYMTIPLPAGARRSEIKGEVIVFEVFLVLKSLFSILPFFR